MVIIWQTLYLKNDSHMRKFSMVRGMVLLKKKSSYIVFFLAEQIFG